MYTFEYPKDMSVGRVCLELSLKPFKSLEQAYIEGVCEELFDQWRELLRYASGCSVLLWTADGSEILTYTGDLDDEIEWARYLGIANPPDLSDVTDPEKANIHIVPRLYTDQPATITYRDLKRIVEALKRVGKRVTGLDVQVGETFDPGPEFAVSDFKYGYHEEISSPANGETGSIGWVHCTARLHADSRRYAAYPDGIPEGLPLGNFLGAQYRRLAEDMGFDYIWFSNGFGYSKESWSWTGECFDGKTFAGGERVSALIVEFWELFTKEFPGVRIETRGSNLSTGMDIAAHGSPLASIYEFTPFAPPNSPWAALDAQFGLELVGFMSHIAETPPEGFLFRYYPHDPWWINSPWFDRYGRRAHDIYLPLAVARFDENLKTSPPCGISFLTADDSFGNLPRRGPVEITPHLLDAYSHYPDEPGLVTWVYPWERYHALLKQPERVGEALFGDWLIKSGLDAGMPMNSVISDKSFAAAAKKIAGKTILVLPVPDGGSGAETALFAALEAGASALLYGPVRFASDQLKALLGLADAPPREGSFTVKSRLPRDSVMFGDASDILRHDALLSGGPLDAVSPDALVTAQAQDGEAYAYAAWNGNALSGRLGWLRGSFPSDPDTAARLPKAVLPSKGFQPGELFRAMLSLFGVSVSFTRREIDDANPMVLFSKYKNGYYVTSYAPDTTCGMALTLPEGAPLLFGEDCVVRDSVSHYNLTRCFHTECRVFVRQKQESKVVCRVKHSGHPGIDRRMLVCGLVDADVTFRKIPGTILTLYSPPNGMDYGDRDLSKQTNVPFTETPDGLAVCKGITGSLLISWGVGDHFPIAIDWSM